MCKQKGHSYCSELGEDPSEWSKVAPLSKPSWIIESFEILSNALSFARNGNLEKSVNLLKNSADLQMRSWFDLHGQNSGTWRYKSFGIPEPSPIVPLDSVKKFERFEPEIFARDNFHCRYCASPVLPEISFREINALLGDEFMPLGRTNLTRSGFYLMFVATLDHVLPWSLGGRTNGANLVTSCWSCNYGKAHYTVEQLGIENPFWREVLKP